MQNLFYEVNTLDKRCYDEFLLSEEILMEHAASGMAGYIKEQHKDARTILIVCGSGNNGADGIALARMLHKRFKVALYLHKMPSSQIGKVQLKRAEAVGVEVVKKLEDADVIVDALFGSGLNRNLDQQSASVLEEMNCLQGYKVACDIPSGIDKDGHLYKHAFVADVTLTMGGLKRGLYSDKAKDYVGDIKVLELGIAREVYETDSEWKLLQEDDLIPPYRNKKNTHKGNFGHLALIHGEKEGATTIAALASLRYGAGLITMVGEKISSLPCVIMQDVNLPENTTAIACGMGLGREYQRDRLSSMLSLNIPMVLDADIFYHSIFYELLHKEAVITPHPKEFVYILKKLNLADITVHTLQENRFKYVELFSEAFEHIVLVLKGANTIVAHKKRYFINPHGTSILAKGGSGDILSGICGALLAQGYSPLEAAIQATLAQTLSAKNVKRNSYALSPQDIIEGLSWL